jgi:CheY-like chemotaxis protein
MEELLMILVVEDDQIIQGIVEEALRDGGFATAIASSGEQARELLTANRYYRAGNRRKSGPRQDRRMGRRAAGTGSAAADSGHLHDR